MPVQRSSDPTLSAEDVALGYKELAEVERGWRDLKHVLDLRPVYHRKEVRIRAHVLLCWLALLLIRVAEISCGETWPTLRRELERLQVGTFAGPVGSFRKRTQTTVTQHNHARCIPCASRKVRPPLSQALILFRRNGCLRVN